MAPERLNHLIEQCFRKMRKGSRSAFHRDIAAFLEVDPATLRRWLAGETPIPKPVEIVFEIFNAWPEVTAARVMEVIDLVD